MGSTKNYAIIIFIRIKIPEEGENIWEKPLAKAFNSIQMALTWPRTNAFHSEVSKCPPSEPITLNSDRILISLVTGLLKPLQIRRKYSEKQAKIESRMLSNKYGHTKG